MWINSSKCYNSGNLYNLSKTNSVTPRHIFITANIEWDEKNCITWVLTLGIAGCVSSRNNIDVECKYTKREIKLAVAETFMMQWHSNLNNVSLNPILRTYRNLKFDFRMEPHLNLVTNYKYRNAITKLRASSHTLEVERGRYTNPKTPLNDRLCSLCGIIEDEAHFLVGCKSYTRERQELFAKIINVFPQNEQMNDTDKFVFMLSYPDQNLLTIVGNSSTSASSWGIRASNLSLFHHSLLVLFSYMSPRVLWRSQVPDCHIVMVTHTLVLGTVIFNEECYMLSMRRPKDIVEGYGVGGDRVSP